MNLTSARDVIAVLGGPQGAASLAGVGYKAAAAWQRDDVNRMAPNTYELFQRILRRRGYSAPGHLWGMKQQRKQERRRRGPPRSGTLRRA